MKAKSALRIVVCFFLLGATCFLRANSYIASADHLLSNTPQDSANKNKGLFPPLANSKKSQADNSDTLMTWLNKAPADTNTLNTLLPRCNQLLQTRSREEVMGYLNKCRSICDQILKNSSGLTVYSVQKKLAHSFIIESMLNLYNGDFEKEVTILNKALNIFKAIKHQNGMAHCYNNLGANQAEQGKFPEALQFHLKALKIRENLHDTSGIGYSYYNISEMYRRMQDHPQALKYGLEALKIRIKQNDYFGIAESLSSVGSSYYGNLNMDMALHYFQKARLANDSLGNIGLQGHIYNNLGSIYNFRKQADSSIFYYNKALVIYAEIADGYSSSMTRTNLGHSYILNHDYNTAKKILLKNLDSLKKYKQTNLIESSYDFLMQCDSALGNYIGALHYSRLLNEATYDNVVNQNLDKFNELRVKYDLQKKEEDNRRLLDQNHIQTLKLNRNRLLFFILLALFVFGLLSLFLLFQRNKYRIAGDQTKLEQRLLRTQMNPHFIFNALQAIQYYVDKHSKKETVKYLDSFANLTRAVLENSRTELIPLEKEILLLKDYVDLQKLRFDNRFEFFIHIADNVFPEKVFIPPMLSQPFIENAIEHGLGEVAEGGRIEVFFNMENETLLMQIIDNGMGLQEDDDQQKKHNSLAVEITRERMELLNKKNKRKSSFVITEAFPQDSQRKGVKVFFKIPLPVIL